MQLFAMSLHAFFTNISFEIESLDFLVIWH